MIKNPPKNTVTEEYKVVESKGDLFFPQIFRLVELTAEFVFVHFVFFFSIRAAQSNQQQYHSLHEKALIQGLGTRKNC